MFEPDLAYIQKYRAYPCPGLLATCRPSSVRLLNADPTTPLSVCMGTVLGNANPVLPVSEYFVREAVPVDPPLYSSPFGPIGEPLERDIIDSSATDIDDDDLSSDVFTTVVGYERPFCLYVSTSDTRFIERSPYRRDNTQADLLFLTVKDCDGFTICASGSIATTGPRDGPCTSAMPIANVLKRDVGTMPRYAYWDMPAPDRVSIDEEEMPDLYHRVLSDVDPFAAECVYLTDKKLVKRCSGKN